MRSRVSLLLVVALLLSACSGRLIKKQYEYEEELYLALDGTATLDINASVPALVALRGADLNPSPRARFERERIRAFYEGPGVTVTALSSSRRYGRRFVHVSLDVADVRALQRLAPFAWSTYRFAREGDVYEFKQVVGASSGKSVGDVGWDGSELIVFRMHLPSKIAYYNAPSHRTERGNIVEWEQPLADRLRGMPVEIDVQMQTQSILARTLLLFAASVVAALATLAATVWWIARRGQGAGGRGQESTVGWIAAVCYATMVLPFLLAQAPVHDLALVPFTNLALGFLWRAGRDSGCPGRSRAGSGIRDSLLAAVALGFSILSKGLEGVAIVGLGYGLYLLFTRALTWRLVLHGVLVVGVAVLVALPWYLAMNAREPGYLRYYFVDRHLLGFATDTQRHSGQPWWFYLPIVVGGGLPWLLLIRKSHVLLWTWLASSVALLSLSQSKAVTYVLPAMPAIAILAAISPVSLRTWRRVGIGTAATCAAAVALFGPLVARSHSARDLADYFNAAGRLPATIFVFDQRVSFVYYLRPEIRRQLHADQIRSVSVEELAAMQPFPRDAVVTVPMDLAAERLPPIPQLANAQRDVAGRYLVVSPGVRPR